MTQNAVLDEQDDAALTVRRRTLTLSALGTFLALALFTVPISALPSVAAALGAGAAGQTWILSSMSVGLAAGLLISGALADDFGRRRVFFLGASVTAVTLLVGALASTTLVFVLARIGQGLGAAAVIACGLGLIGHAFPDPHGRTSATGIWGAAVGAGIAVGPLLSATLGPVLGWRSPYLLLMVLTSAFAVAARMLLVESRRSAEHVGRPDLPGAVLLGVGLSALLAGLVTGREGWLRAQTLIPLIASVLLLVGFVLVELRTGRRGIESGGAPLLDLGLLRRQEFVAVTVAGLATGMGVIAVMSFLPTLMERGLGAGALVGSLGIVIWSGVSVPVALVARRLRINGDVQLAIGLAVVAVGLLLLGGLHSDDGLPRLVPGLIIAGVGSGVLNAALGRQAVASVPPDRAGMGSGANNTARYLGSAIGVTVLVGLATRPGQLLANWNAAVLTCVVFSLAGAAAVLLCLRRNRH